MSIVYSWVLGAGFIGFCLGAALRFAARFEDVV